MIFITSDFNTGYINKGQTVNKRTKGTTTQSFVCCSLRMEFIFVVLNVGALLQLHGVFVFTLLCSQFSPEVKQSAEWAISNSLEINLPIFRSTSYWAILLLLSLLQVNLLALLPCSVDLCVSMLPSVITLPVTPFCSPLSLFPSPFVSSYLPHPFSPFTVSVSFSFSTPFLLCLYLKPLIIPLLLCPGLISETWRVMCKHHPSHLQWAPCYHLVPTAAFCLAPSELGFRH